MKKYKRVICLVVLLFVFTATVAWAWIPQAIAAAITLRTVTGAVITYMMRNAVVKDIVAAATASGVGYLAFKLIDGDYAAVPLTETKAAVEAEKAKLVAADPSLATVRFATFVDYWDSVCSGAGCTVTRYAYPIPSDTVFCMRQCVSGCTYPLSGISFSQTITYASQEYVVATIKDRNNNGTIIDDSYDNLMYAWGVCDYSAKNNYNGTSSGLTAALLRRLEEIPAVRDVIVRAIGRDGAKQNVGELTGAPANSYVIDTTNNGDVYVTNNYADARSYTENVLQSETQPVEETAAKDTTAAPAEELSAPPTSDGSCGDYAYKNKWDVIKVEIKTAIEGLALYALINKLADLTGQSGFPHQYTMDLSGVNLGVKTIDLDQGYLLELLAVLRWSVTSMSFILAWKIATS